MQRSSFFRQLGLLTAAAGLLSFSDAQAQVAFTAGNYVVVQVGATGSTTALGNTGTPVYLNEYSPTGTLVQQIAVPAADALPNLALTVSGTATSEGSLTRSADGRYLVLAGYNAPTGTAGVASSAVATINRVVARVASTGAVNTTTRITDAFDGTNIRGAASANGSAFYAVGGTSGVRYVTLGNTGASTALNSATPLNLRAIGIFGGNLYATSSSATSPATTPATGTYGVVQAGTGLPTTTGQTLALLPGFPNTSGPSSYGFFFADLSATTPGVDVVYVADDRTTTDGGIQKWSLVSGNWVLNGTIAGGTAALRGLTGSVSGSTVTLAAAGSAGLYFLTDNTGYNVTPTATLPATPAAASPANTAFRGVALAPLATALAARPATALELGLYPNPTTDVLTITLPGTSSLGHSAEVRDLLGRTVRTTTLPASGELSLTGLPAGTYLLTVDGTLTRRISKAE